MAELVDGNNLLGRMGGGDPGALVAELAELARRKRKDLIVVFDGPPPAGRPKVQHLGPVTAVYAAPRTADDEILRRVREARDPRGVTVVTDDRGLASAIQAAGARTRGLAEFRGEAHARLSTAVADAPAPGPPLSAREWERWFSDPKNRMDR